MAERGRFQESTYQVNTFTLVLIDIEPSKGEMGKLSER